jgi:hypothetical protein
MDAETDGFASELDNFLESNRSYCFVVGKLDTKAHSPMRLSQLGQTGFEAFRSVRSWFVRAGRVVPRRDLDMPTQ